MLFRQRLNSCETGNWKMTRPDINRADHEAKDIDQKVKWREKRWNQTKEAGTQARPDPM
ncbi:hypothetical protein J21TS7_47770 [Paenibacillus cineris]|uniref:Uncharacterized protein n=1 Tax=Paenibacillus cineris TaxID=237530 RepID=A0ABQ4LIV9_9BACL|nr:hypothetical protein J21TS7_47770 [Paenibacillus cineris]GIO62137.1 hypothetical protein J43TS9_37110 [Paenibacillus cineris]